MRTTTQIVLSLLLVASAGFLLVGYPAGQQEATDLETVVLDVQGMHSMVCELGVKMVLNGIGGVEKVSVDREQGEVQASFDPALASPEQLVKAVNAIGFRAKVKGDFSAEAVQTESPTLSCAFPSSTGELAELIGLSAEQLPRVVDYVVKCILSSTRIPSGQEIARATGVELSRKDVPAVQQAVISKLAADPEGLKFLKASRCSDYGACSLTSNLVTASGQELEMYMREKEEDGQTYANFQLPAFEASDLSGNTVRSADVIGEPTVVAFLALHCNHSIDSLPILQQLKRQYPDVNVLGVLVNSGTVEDTNYWVPYFSPQFDKDFDIWVYNDPSLGDLVKSHLVPTYFFVDKDGRVKKKLVGFKTHGKIKEALSALQLD